MDKLEDKSFRILFSGRPVGADNCDNCAVKPVITDGQMIDWSFKDGCLVLNDTFYCSYKDNKVVVCVNKDVCECTQWVLVPVEGGLGVIPGQYFIMLPGPIQRAWTADPFKPKSPVTLVPSGSVRPEYQLFEIDEADTLT